MKVSKELMDKIGELLDRSTTISAAEKAVLLLSIALLIEEWSTCWYVRSERVVQFKGHWTRNTYTHWHVCHEVHLLDDVQLGGIPGWLDMPPAVEYVAGAIPPLLWPHLGTVVGTMVRERHISWLMGEVAYPVKRVQPQRKLIIDPAIVIGSIVLTGWENPEHQRPGWWMRLDRYFAG
jgi:hypothetical protein